MRAWQVVEHGEPEAVMKLGEKAVPQPGPGEVRILVKALALGLPDVFMCRGTYAMGELIHAEDTRAIIITGAGKSFCAGGDTAYISQIQAVTRAPVRVDARSGRDRIGHANVGFFLQTCTHVAKKERRPRGSRTGGGVSPGLRLGRRFTRLSRSQSCSQMA